jgi:ABC-type lipoprotein release transport system permease subunit
VGAIVVVEAVFVTVLAWALAVLAAWPITAALGRLFTAALFPSGLDIALSREGIAGWLVLSTALALVSSLAPAVRASRRPVREAVSHE